MTKFHHSLLLILLLSNSSLAYVSGKVMGNENKIFCPEKITCAEAGNVNTCKFEVEMPSYWVLRAPTYQTYAEIYHFIKVISSYQANATTICMYESNISGSQGLLLDAKIEANLQPNHLKSSSWDQQSNACISSSTAFCPLKVSSGVGFYYDQSINQNRVFSPVFTLNNERLPISQSYDRAFIPYEVMGKCMSEKSCKIDIAININESEIIPVGNIVVDMDNKLDIIRINSYPSAPVYLRKIEPFNSIEIRKSIEHQHPFIDIENKLFVNLNVYANGMFITKISSSQTGSLYYSRIIEVCTESGECNITIKTPNGGSIGTLTLDMKNEMHILTMASVRSSEIELNKVKSNLIQIKYAD